MGFYDVGYRNTHTHKSVHVSADQGKLKPFIVESSIVSLDALRFWLIQEASQVSSEGSGF